MRRALAGGSDEVDDAGDRVRAIQGAFGAANDFDLRDAIGGQRGKVEVAAELVQGDAVDHHQVVIRVSATHEGAGGSSAAAGVGDGDAGEFAQHFGDALGVAAGDLIGGDDADRRGCVGCR